MGAASPTAPGPVLRARYKGRALLAGRTIDNIVVLLVVTIIWQALFEYAGDVAITPPLQTLAFAASLLRTDAFWNHVGATAAGLAYAVAISVALGVTLGLFLGLRRFAGDVSEPLLAALYTTPKVTLYPVVLLTFGLGIAAKVAFGVLHGVIPIILFTLTAVKNVSPVFLRTARVMKLAPWQIMTTLLMPAVMPEIFTGLRVGFSLTILGVLIGEMFASQRGLGFLIINGINSHNVAMTTAVILIVVVFAIAANGLLLALDHRLHRRAG